MKVSRLFLAAALLLPALSIADTPGRHPAYLHARTDLWRATFILESRDEENVMRDLRAAGREVRDAIGEIDRAAVLDRKDLDDHPRVDTNLRGKGKFRAAAQLLWSAKRDLLREEDNRAARGWRDAAIAKIDHALELVRRAARDDRFDDEFRRMP